MLNTVNVWSTHPGGTPCRYPAPVNGVPCLFGAPCWAYPPPPGPTPPAATVPPLTGKLLWGPDCVEVVTPHTVVTTDSCCCVAPPGDHSLKHDTLLRLFNSCAAAWLLTWRTLYETQTSSKYYVPQQITPPSSLQSTCCSFYQAGKNYHSD
jgi:hypothetical protein